MGNPKIDGVNLIKREIYSIMQRTFVFGAPANIFSALNIGVS